MQTTDSTPPPRTKRGLKWLLLGLGLLLLVNGGMYFINPYGTSSSAYRARVLGYAVRYIPSESMTPTLQVGDHLWIDTKAYRSTGPQAGDIVATKVHADGDAVYTMRVLGLAGDTLEIEKGVLRRNGEVMDEPYLDRSLMPTFQAAEPKSWTVPEGQFFILGDNRDDARDSRYIGALPLAFLEGKAVSIIKSDTPERVGLHF